MGRTRTVSMKVHIRAPDPEYPGDGYELVGIAGGATPRECSCGLGVVEERDEQSHLIQMHPVEPEHELGCTFWLLNDQDALREEIGNVGLEELLWGDEKNLPSLAPEFVVTGFLLWCETGNPSDGYDWDCTFEIEQVEDVVETEAAHGG